MKGKYSIGIDFGTLSARAVLVSAENGDVTATATKEYAHGVMETELPCGVRLKAASALQHPADYMDALCETVGSVIRGSGVDPADIVGVATDFTSSSVLPIDSEGTPLCLHEKYKDHPQAYVKMWKNHTAGVYAERLRILAEERGESFLENYSGSISSEWLIPKLHELLEEDEELYQDTAKYIEAGDYIVMKLTGELATSSGNAGFKALYSHEDGFLSKEFLKALDPRLENAVSEKLVTRVLPVGSIAGYVNREGSRLTGLAEGTPVCVNSIDAHAAVPAMGVTEPGTLLLIMGTSTCHLAMSEDKKACPGITGVVRDGFVDGCFAYEAGQNCVGDSFDWFVRSCVPAEYKKEAERRGISVHDLLSELAAAKRPGESGLLALDWWNGCRSDLMDDRLTGMIVGMNLSTRAEDIYRALIEATAFGTRLICENYEAAGIMFDEIIAGGGIAKKNSFMMQIYADVLEKPIHIADTDQAGAMGCAVMAAAAGGVYADLTSAANSMVKPCVKTYYPRCENAETYGKLYREYVRLHDIFGGEGGTMKQLLDIRDSI